MANKWGTVWSFKTKNFLVTLEIERDRNYHYQYDGDDDDGEIRAKLKSGEWVAFDSKVEVTFLPTNEVIGSDYLGGSVYASDEVSDFWTDHMSPNHMDRNCSLMQAVRGKDCSICHYFPSMVQQAIKEARKSLAVYHSVPIRTW